MKKYEVESFHVPPENRGQMIEVAYGMDPYSEVIVERTIDSSTGATTYVAYDGAECERFEPWNAAPELGASYGECEITDGRRIDMTITDAIERSRTHTEIVTIDVPDLDAARAEIVAAYDGETDSVRNGDVLEVWGWTKEQADDEMDFRVHLRLLAR